jgi:hypothetical protein
MSKIKYLDLAGLTAYDGKLKEWIKSCTVDITDDEIRALFVTAAEGPADNEIWYTTVDGNIYDISAPDQINKFNTNILSNTYENGKGIIVFADTLTHLYDADGRPNGAFSYQVDGARIDTIYFPNGLKYIGKLTIWEQSPSVSYNGTKEQWGQIEKNSMWYCGSDDVVVHCIDGDIIPADN